MKGTWQTTSDGSNVLLAAALIAIAVIAVPVLTLVAHVLELLAIIVIAFVALAAAAGAALVVHRVRHRQPVGSVDVSRPRPVHWRAAQPLSAPRRPAIGAPKQELHLHFHGVDADDVAAIIARQRGD